jgi:thioredoxin reductase (NADPH)
MDGSHSKAGSLDGWLGGCLALDEQRFVKTGADLRPEELEAVQWPLRRRPYQFETSVPRVFAVGDVPVRKHEARGVRGGRGLGRGLARPQSACRVMADLHRPATAG